MLDRAGRPVRAVSLVGRMGNQLFQYAVARAQLSPGGEPVVVDDRENAIWGDDLSPVLRPGQFRAIRQGELIRLRAVPRLVAGQRTAVAKREQLAQAHPWWRRFEVTDAVAPTEIAARVAETRHCLLRGYFQNEGYFVDAAASVRSAFRPASDDVRAFVHAAAAGSPTVGISMRTGADYGEFGVLLERDYYLRGADRMRGLVDDPSYVVFGDVAQDAQWLADQLVAAGGRATVAANLSAADQLLAMAAMDHLVITNSSFAWWGAWLGDMDRAGFPRVVIRPSRWLPSAGDICPDRWLVTDADYAKASR
jgi:hypothetical protein